MSTAVRSRRFDLGWMKPPKPAEDGRMALVDHLREFRYRVTFAAVAVAIAAVVAWFFFTPLFDFIKWPLTVASTAVKASHPEVSIKNSYEGLASPMLLKIELCAMAGFIATTPVWLYQLWAFVVPGLYARERRWALTFLGAAVPLFLAGCATGFVVLPKAYEFMLNFVPNDKNAIALLEVNQFLATEMKLVLLFGLSFLLPVVLVMLNAVGVLKGQQLRSFRKFGIFLCFVFGAVATPSTDPFSMMALALPMAVLYVVAELITVRNDKRRLARADDLTVTL